MWLEKKNISAGDGSYFHRFEARVVCFGMKVVVEESDSQAVLYSL